MLSQGGEDGRGKVPLTLVLTVVPMCLRKGGREGEIYFLCVCRRGLVDSTTGATPTWSPRHVGGHSIAWDSPQPWSCMSIMTWEGLRPAVGVLPAVWMTMYTRSHHLSTVLLTLLTFHSHNYRLLFVVINCDRMLMNVREQPYFYRSMFNYNIGCTPGDRVVAERWHIGIARSHNIHHESITIFHFIKYLHSIESHNILPKCCYVFVYVPHHSSPSLYNLSFHQWANGGLDNVCHVSCVASCLSFIT